MFRTYTTISIGLVFPHDNLDGILVAISVTARCGSVIAEDVALRLLKY